MHRGAEAAGGFLELGDISEYASCGAVCCCQQLLDSRIAFCHVPERHILERFGSNFLLLAAILVNEELAMVRKGCGRNFRGCHP